LVEQGYRYTIVNSEELEQGKFDPEEAIRQSC